MVKKIQLKNKLKVLMIENHKSPVVSVQMWVKTGSADEPPQLAGISHFIEHLVFKGSDKYKVGEIAKVVESSGGELNAYTSFDQTVFYVTISKQFDEMALDVVSQMMGFPQFDPQEIDNEREVVCEEIKMGQDSLGRKASQLLFSTVFKKHNYGRPVIGFEKIIRKTSAKKIVEYYHQRYVPENMFLVVSGDFKSAEMQKNIKKYFEIFKPRKLKKFPRQKEPAQKSVRIKYEKTEFNNSNLYLSWRIPNVKHKDIAALEMLASIFGGGETSRLVKKLRLENPYVNSVGSFAYPLLDDGLFAVSVNFRPENLEKILPILIEEFQILLQHGVDFSELQRAVTNVAAHEVYSLETVDQLARKAGTYEFYMKDPDYFKKYIQQVYQLDTEKVLKAGKKYLQPGQFSLAVLSSTDKKKTEILLKDFSKNLSKALKEAKKPSVKIKKIKKQKLTASKLSSAVNKKHDLEKVHLANGHSLILKHQSDLPHIVLKSVQKGGLLEEKGAEGQTELLSRCWSLGSQNFSEEKIHTLLDEKAANVYSYGGRNSIGLGLECLSIFENEIFDLYEDILTRPVFLDRTLEREKTMMQSQIQSRNDSPAQMAILNFSKKFFANHPYSRDVLGTLESVKELSAPMIQSYFSALNNPMTFCLVGQFDKNKMIQRFQKISEKIKTKTKTDRVGVPTEILKEERIFQFLKKEQSHVVIGYKGLQINDERRKVLEVIEAVLSGQGGRLFLELRDKKSLAYSVSPIHMEGLGAGYFGAYIGCSPEKTTIAIDMLKSEFAKLVDTPISPVELERAQKYLAGQFDIHLQKKSSICNTLLFDDFYGLDFTKSLNSSHEYFDITSKQVQSLAQELFSTKPIISAVGTFDINK
ncbi:MAG: M16 family metallopeptidase [Pseudobdellovibrionaceae bacterium]